MLEIRLANPFPISRPAERHLWWLTGQLNFPLLSIGSQYLEQHATGQGATDHYFVSQDGWLWRRHQILFP